MPNSIVSGIRARQQLQAGIDALADVLAVTLGPLGRNVVVDNELTHKPEILESAAEIARRMTSLNLAHRNPGAMLLRHLVWRVVAQAGDGGATAAVFARTLYRESLRLVMAGFDPLALCAGIETASAAVIAALSRQALPVTTEDDLARMALSWVGDERLATILGEMSYLLGENAAVTIEKYALPTTDRIYVSGASYPAQIASPLFYTQPEQKRALATDACVVLLHDPLQTDQDAVELLRVALQTGKKQLVIVTVSPIGDRALTVLSANHRNTAVPLSILPLRLTDVDGARQYPLSDLALLTGAVVLSADSGQPIARLSPDQLGTARRLELRDGRVILESVHSLRHPAVQQAVEGLKERLQQGVDDQAERSALQGRLSALTGGCGILRIGAYSDAERALSAKSAERALRALAAAQRGGVAAGGGAALVHASAALSRLAGDDAEQHGIRLFARALAAPLLQLLQNAAVDAPEAVVQQLRTAAPPITFDVLTRQFVDGHTEGIVTPVAVLESVVRLATSTVVMALTTETILYRQHHEKIEQLEP